MKNIAGLMKQASQMQQKMQEMQAALETAEVEGQAGAGMVTVVLSGKGDMKRVKIDPKLADPAEMEMLEDLRPGRPCRCAAQGRGHGGRGNAEGDRRPAAAARHEAAFLMPAGRPGITTAAEPWAAQKSSG